MVEGGRGGGREGVKNLKVQHTIRTSVRFYYPWSFLVGAVEEVRRTLGPLVSTHIYIYVLTEYSPFFLYTGPLL